MTQEQDVQPGPDDPRSPSEQVERGAKRFAGRAWALRSVVEWTRNPDGRFFVLTGEPGAGKSAFAAWMAGHGRVPDDATAATDLATVRGLWSVVHFCRSKAGGTIDPKNFAISISTQLTVRHEGFGEAALHHLAPDYQITQNVRENSGQIIGIKAQQVIVNSRDADDVYDKAVRQPLRDLAVSKPGLFPMFFLVDGLDEAWGRSEPNIVSLLERSDDLPAGVHVLFTSRETPWMLERLTGRPGLDLSGAEFGAENDADIRAFVEERLSADDIAAKAASLSNRQEVVDSVVSRASGNFLFVEFLLDEAANGARELKDLAGSPAGLFPLYRQYLDRLLPAVAQPGGADAWVDTYRPLLGGLSVAVPSAPEPALPRWLGWEAEDVDLRLGEVRQLWEDITDPGGDDGGYRLYHRSLAEFLAAKEYKESADEACPTKNRYFAAPKTQHERIATYYLSIGVGPDGDWGLSDRYGLREVIPHVKAWLDLEEDPQKQKVIAKKLYDAVLDPRLGVAQQDRFGGVDPSVASYRVALDTAMHRDDLGVAEQIVTSLASDLDPELRALGREFAQRIQAVDPGRFGRLAKGMLT